MKMQNQAKLAAEAYRGHIIKHTSKCLHWSAAAMPAAALRAAAICGVDSASLFFCPPSPLRRGPVPPPRGGTPPYGGGSHTPNVRNMSRSNTHVLMGGVFWRLGKVYEHWSVSAMPAAACAQLPFKGGGVAHREQPPSPKYLREKSEFAHWNFIIHKNFTTPPCYQGRKPPIPNPSIPNNLFLYELGETHKLTVHV